MITTQQSRSLINAYEKLKPMNLLAANSEKVNLHKTMIKFNTLKNNTAVHVSISEEAIKNYKEQLKIKEENNDTLDQEALMFMDAVLSEKNTIKSKYLLSISGSVEEQYQSLLKTYALQYDEIVQEHKNNKRAIFINDPETGFRAMTLEEELADLEKEYKEKMDRLDKHQKFYIREYCPRMSAFWERAAEREEKFYKTDPYSIEIAEKARRASEHLKIESQQTIPENGKDIMAKAMKKFVERYNAQKAKETGIEDILKTIQLFS